MSSHLLARHIEERQPQCGRCHLAVTGQTTLEVTGSKGSYTLKWWSQTMMMMMTIKCVVKVQWQWYITAF